MKSAIYSYEKKTHVDSLVNLRFVVFFKATGDLYYRAAVSHDVSQNMCIITTRYKINQGCQNMNKSGDINRW